MDRPGKLLSQISKKNRQHAVLLFLLLLPSSPYVRWRQISLGLLSGGGAVNCISFLSATGEKSRSGRLYFLTGSLLVTYYPFNKMHNQCCSRYLMLIRSPLAKYIAHS